jgi:hypothetical protein
VNTIKKHEVEKISPKSLIKESSMEIKSTIESISQVEFIRWYIILTCPLWKGKVKSPIPKK